MVNPNWNIIKNKLRNMLEVTAIEIRKMLSLFLYECNYLNNKTILTFFKGKITQFLNFSFS